jgi:GTPase
MSSESNSRGGVLIGRGRTHSRVAIIGRPNVGKSTLFNILTESRKAVVKDQPGVTRDILIEPAEIWGKKFDVIDTGGLTEATDTYSVLIREQVVEFLKSVDLLICVMDGRVGLVPEDRDIIRIAIETGMPFVLVANKIDSVTNIDTAAAEFYEFGVDVIATSFERRYGIAELSEWITSHIGNSDNTLREGLTIAIVGKPNVGKSSLVNRLLGENRQMVSDVAGTTVDAVDTELQWNGKKYILIDTAGLRKKEKREEDVEIISAFKSRDAIRRADLVLLMVDGSQGPTTQDAKILEEILRLHKAVILVANKIDVSEKEIPAFRQWFRDKATDELHFFEEILISFISAKTGRGINELFAAMDDVERKLNIDISTSDLNDFFMSAIRQAPSPVYGTQNVKFYYLTQTQQVPPAFIAFANHPEGVTPSYRRFLAKRMQERFGLQGVPIRIFIMKSRKAARE